MKKISYQEPLTIFEDTKRNILHESIDESIYSYNHIYNNKVYLNSNKHIIFIKNLKGQFICCNKAFLFNSGYNKAEEIYLKTDLDMIWGEKELVLSFNKKDIKINSGISQLNIGKYPYCESLKTMLVRRFPLYKDNKVVANIGIMKDISAFNENQLKLLIYDYGIEKIENKILDILLERYINCNINKYLSPYQLKILYFFVRNYTAKEIGFKVKRSSRTIEDNLSTLKILFNCKNNLELQRYLFNSSIIKDFL